MIPRLAAFLFALFSLCGAAFGQFYDVLEIPLIGLTNSAQTIRGNAGPVLWYSCNNPNTSQVWLQFYDSVAAITVGTTANSFAIPIAPNISTGFDGFTPAGLSYGAKNGLQVAATTTQNGATGPTTPLMCSFGYK